MASMTEPWIGLVWITNSDPTVGPGVAAPLWQPLIRTDTEQFYYKSGTAPTAWTPLTGGGGGGGVNVQDNGTPVVTPATTLNFTGAGVTVTDAGGGVAHVAIAGGISGIDVEEDGTPVVNPATAINFTGGGATVTDAGGGVADVAIPSVSVAKDGSSVVDPATVFNFTGAAVDVTDAGGGQADIDVGINIDQNETPKVTRAKQINFSGDDPITVSVSDLGGGVANVIVAQSLTGAQHGLISFVGGEDPNNIPVTLAVAMSGDYIVQLTYWPFDPTAGTVQPFLVSQTDAQNFVIGLSASPLANDQVMYSVFLRT